MKISEDFTKRTAQEKLYRIEKRLEVAEAIVEEIKSKPDDYYPYLENVISIVTVNSLLDKISVLLSNMTNEIQIDLYDLKTCLHHLNALPIRNNKGELE